MGCEFGGPNNRQYHPSVSSDSMGKQSNAYGTPSRASSQNYSSSSAQKDYN
ncbi:MAG: hypothetical protein AABX96_00345 [Nanoarchaeota archaeon]